MAAALPETPRDNLEPDQDANVEARVDAMLDLDAPEPESSPKDVKPKPKPLKISISHHDEESETATAAVAEPQKPAKPAKSIKVVEAEVPSAETAPPVPKPKKSIAIIDRSGDEPAAQSSEALAPEVPLPDTGVAGDQNLAEPDADVSNIEQPATAPELPSPQAEQITATIAATPDTADPAQQSDTEHS